jgi:hypothetical protein
MLQFHLGTLLTRVVASCTGSIVGNETAAATAAIRASMANKKPACMVFE